MKRWTCSFCPKLPCVLMIDVPFADVYPIVTPKRCPFDGSFDAEWILQGSD